MRIRYDIAVPRPSSHVADVAVTVSEVRAASVDLAMAAWSPGSYLIRDYARHVMDVTAGGARIDKVDKQTWRVEVGDAGEVTVRYRVYAHELTVRTNHIDATHAFLHGPATFLYCPDAMGAVDGPIEVHVSPPAGWRVHTGLAGGPVRFAAADVDELLDCPIHMSAADPIAFEAAGAPAELVLWGEPRRGVATIDDLVADLSRVMAAHAERFGGVPYDRYLFLLMLSPGGYGGLEHRNSSANLNTPFALETRDGYEALLELLSHEYFHVWNGKRIRPAALGPFDYSREAYTRALWVQEGITSYYDRHTLCAAGVQAPERYLKKLAEEWGKLQRVPGRRRQSLEQASFDAWIKLYKPDEATVNTTVSYYLKGGLVALCLDAAIRDATGGARTLADAVRRLWERYGRAPRGYADADVQAEFEAAVGAPLAEPFDRWIRGTEDPDLAAALAAAGLELRASFDPEPAAGGPPAWLGVALKSDAAVTAVLDGGPAAAAGVAAGDELVAIDGYRVRSDADVRARLAPARPGDRVRLAAFRRDQLVDLAVELGAAPPNRFEIASVATPTEAQRERFRAWLGQPLPADGVRAAATIAGWC